MGKIVSVIPALALCSASLAQVVGPPVAVPHGSDPLGPTAHYFEPVVAVSSMNPKEVMAGAMQWSAASQATDIHYGISLDAGTTFTTGLLSAPGACQPGHLTDPFVGSSVVAGHMWIGGLVSAPNAVLPGFAIARRPASKIVLDPTSYICTPYSHDKGWLAVGPGPGGSPVESLYLDYQLANDGCDFGHLANVESNDSNGTTWGQEYLIQPPSGGSCLYQGNGAVHVGAS
jgi:hypothetical protein